MLRNYRRNARELMAHLARDEENAAVLREVEQLIQRLIRYGLVGEGATLNDILSLTVEDFLERRLQTQVFRQGLASSFKQARQFIVHGHIAIKGQRVNVPSYLVPLDAEMEISYYSSSPLATTGHPATTRKVIKEA